MQIFVSDRVTVDRLSFDLVVHFNIERDRFS